MKINYYLYYLIMYICIYLLYNCWLKFCIYGYVFLFVCWMGIFVVYLYLDGLYCVFGVYGIGIYLCFGMYCLNFLGMLKMGCELYDLSLVDIGG